MSVSPFVYALPFLAAGIGWFTNYLAIKMLFHPREPINLGFYTLQGIFPKRQKVLAEKLGKVVSQDLIHIDEIKAKLLNPETDKAIHEVITSRLDQFLHAGIKEEFPMLGMFLTGNTLEKIKEVFAREIEKGLPDLIGTYLDKLEEGLNIEEMVTNKVSGFSSDKLESILFSILKKEFAFIEWVGAFLGFLIGCLQLALLFIP